MPKGVNWKDMYMYKSRKEIASTTSVLDQTIQVLKSLNLKYEFNKEATDYMDVNYGDYKFYIRTGKDQRYITIGINDIDTFSLDDEAESIRLHHIIDIHNNVNFAKLICTNNNGNVDVDCTIDLLLMPEIPNCEKYFICAFQTIICTILSYWQMKKEGEEKPVRLSDSELYYYKTGDEIESTPTVWELLFPILDGMKLKYKYDGKGITTVIFKGYEFQIVALKQFKYLSIYFWDVDEFPADDKKTLINSYCIIDYINFALNHRLVCSEVMEGTMTVNAVANILWIPEIPDLGRWLRDVFYNLIVAYSMYVDLKEDPNGLMEAMSSGYSSPSPYLA